jgi:hypothetical protein
MPAALAMSDMMARAFRLRVERSDGQVKSCIFSSRMRSQEMGYAEGRCGNDILVRGESSDCI